MHLCNDSNGHIFFWIPKYAKSIKLPIKNKLFRELRSESYIYQILNVQTINLILFEEEKEKYILG